MQQMANNTAKIKQYLTNPFQWHTNFILKITEHSKLKIPKLNASSQLLQQCSIITIATSQWLSFSQLLIWANWNYLGSVSCWGELANSQSNPAVVNEITKIPSVRKLSTTRPYITYTKDLFFWQDYDVSPSKTLTIAFILKKQSFTLINIEIQ